jgi:hypothetical protein
MTDAPSDTTYQIYQEAQTFKVRITRLGNFIREADGFSSFADAASWVAQAQRLAGIDEEREPIAPPHLRVV